MTSPNLSQRAAAERSANNERMVHADFDMAPFTIAWEAMPVNFQRLKPKH